MAPTTAPAMPNTPASRMTINPPMSRSGNTTIMATPALTATIIEVTVVTNTATNDVMAAENADEKAANDEANG